MPYHTQTSSATSPLAYYFSANREDRKPRGRPSHADYAPRDTAWKNFIFSVHR